MPTEDVIEIRRGRKVNSERNSFPGYVLVKMESDRRGLPPGQERPKVTGFLGRPPSRRRPPDVRSRASSIGGKRASKRPKPTIRFDIGEKVHHDGPFASFDGPVESVDEDPARLRVAVSIFGRETPVDLEYSQVEKGGRRRHGGGFEPEASPQSVEEGLILRKERMAKKIFGYIKLQVPAGAANPSPPIGPALGSARREHHGLLQGV